MTTAKIILNNGYVAVIDGADAALVGQYKWHSHRITGDFIVAKAYVGGGKTRTPITMHRLIAGFPDSAIDHRNGNTLDNRRSNLRIADHSQNGWNARLRCDNTSGYKGVCLRKDTGKYQAQVKHRGKIHYLGTFDTPEAAAEARNQLATKLHGEYARSN